MGFSYILFKGQKVRNSKLCWILFLKVVFTLTNSADPDTMPPYVAFHLGLHHFPKYLFTGILYTKSLIGVDTVYTGLDKQIFSA